MNKKKINENNINSLSFEEALEELENITETFEDGDSALENAVNLYNRGVLLKKHCEKKLKSAEMEISKIVSLPDGDFSLEPLDEK